MDYAKKPTLIYSPSRQVVALQELEETAYWLELIVESGCMPESRLRDLQTETDELTALPTHS